VTGDAKGNAPRARGLRPFELRLAKLRAAKGPACGCGHAHTPGDAHEPSHAPSSNDIPQGGP
jgi:hypothetical protein